ncbi:MAG: hypothetical protein MJB14_23860 [Spirochaetes bacterium]|nr:hypothetical protein [Spirochaetota bacterium]
MTKKVGFVPGDVKVAWVIREASSYIMLSKDTPKPTVNKWMDAYQTVINGNTLKQSAKKWSKELDKTLIFTKDKGFIIK